MVIFATSTCLGFATESQPDIIKKPDFVMEAEDTPDEDPVPPSKPPIPEKCKKKKK